MSSPAQLPKSWQAVRRVVAEAEGRLDPLVYSQIRQVFFADYARSTDPEPIAGTREYHLDEFLCVVDSAGRPVDANREMLDDFKEVIRAHPHFTRWFQIETPANSVERAVLLPARWLCHLCGLRHVTVEMFIDLPRMPGVTLVQIRGLDKAESPGNFDLPCAGHISGLDSSEASMFKELGEELGLGVADLEDLHEVCRFDAPAGGEFRVLYRARLKPEALNHIHMQAGEVAGLAVMRLPDLHLLLERQPERVASGLLEAMKYYRE